VIRQQRVAGTIWKHALLLLVLVVMSTPKDLFILEPSVSCLRKLKCAELLNVANHYKLSCPGSSKKEEIRQKILEYLREEELISDEEGDEIVTDRNTLELKRLEF